MSGAEWAIWGGAAAALGAFSFWIYLRREVPVRGRRILAGVRVLALAILLALLLDPMVPGMAAGRRAPRTWVAVDASLSMAAAAEGEASPWERAVARAGELSAGGARVATFGEEPGTSEAAGALENPPAAVSTRLAPLLERALESGAREVVVLSDLRFEDPLAVRALLERAALDVRFEDVGGEAVNGGVARWEVPPALAGGEGVRAQVAVYASEGAAGREATLEVREEDRLVHTSELVLPVPGRLLPVQVDLPPPAATGEVRYAVRLRLPGDVLADDDGRVAFADVDPEEGLLVAVGLAPDWELRFLLPVLEQVAGLTTRAYLRVGPDRWLRAGEEAGEGTLEGAELRRRVEGSEMLVLQGLGRDAPAWLLDAAGDARRSVVFPSDPEGAAAVGVAAGSPLGGEWYVGAELPPSPLAGDLAGATWQGLPPLTAVLPVSREGQGEAPLLAQLQGSGPGEPALLLRSGSGGRRAVALASGFWRWGFRPGAPREAYRRLWAGVAGWLLADAVAAGGPLLRPEDRVVPRGEEVRWAAPGLAGSQVALRITRGDSAVLDTVLAVPASGASRTPPLPPGSYRYRAERAGGEGAGGASEGRFDVERHTEELRHAAARDLRDAAAAARPAGWGEAGTRPLRTHPLPYLLLLGLLCGEWIGRRRKGLR